MQGVYGPPKCLGEDHRLCDYARRLLNYGAYTSWIQRLLVQVGTLIVILMLHKQLTINNHSQAQYWHDPLAEAEYAAKSLFLADINNQVL